MLSSSPFQHPNPITVASKTAGGSVTGNTTAGGATVGDRDNDAAMVPMIVGVAVGGLLLVVLALGVTVAVTLNRATSNADLRGRRGRRFVGPTSHWRLCRPGPPHSPVVVRGHN